MKNIILRYFETRDGRCIPFQQIGNVGDFCIVLECYPELLEMDQECKYFIPDLLATSDIGSTSDRWREKHLSPELYLDEGDVERQAKDVLDLADIFRMERFQVLGGGEVGDWLIRNCSNRVEQVVASISDPKVRGEEVALSN